MQKHTVMLSPLLALLALGTPLSFAQTESSQLGTSAGFEKSSFLEVFQSAADKNPELVALRNRLQTADMAQLPELYRQALNANPAQVKEITELFMKRNNKLAGEYLRIMLSNPDLAQAAKLPANVSRAVEEELAKSAPAKFIESVSRLVKQYPAEATGILLYANSLARVSPAELASGAEKAYAGAFGGFPLYLLGLGALAGAGGGGGGGSESVAVAVPCGGGPCLPISSEASFRTAEYDSQAGLELVRATTLFAHGGTGSGITVSVFDSGIHAAHSEFVGRIEAGGFDFVGGGVGVDASGHGTHVFGIIAAVKDGIGMHGVAYEAKILPFKIVQNDGLITITDAQTANAFFRATQSGSRIFNNSWGSPTKITEVAKAALDVSLANTLAQARSSVNLGAVFVWSTGNEAGADPSFQSGLPHHYPELESGWLAVTAVDLGGLKPLYPNSCGVAANWCLAAPGGSDVPATGGIVSTFNDGGYARLSGTSLAAPHVSGALAALKSRFPNLSFQQIRNRLLLTANKTGIYANPLLFGQGLMDLSAAASPVGVTLLTLTGAANGAALDSSVSNIVLPASLYSIFAGGLSQAEVMVVDSYQRAPFYVSALNFVELHETDSSFDLDSLFSPPIVGRQSGVTARIGGENRWFSIEGVSAANGSTQSRWYFGNANDRSLKNAIGIASGIPVASNSHLAGFSFRLGDTDESAFRVGAWTDIPDDGRTESTPSPLRFSDSQTLAAVSKGLTVQKSFLPRKDLGIVTSMTYGRPESLTPGFSAAGAFDPGTIDSLSTEISARAKTPFPNGGNLWYEVSGQHMRLTTANANTLLSAPRHFQLADLAAKTNYDAPNGKTKLELNAGRTFTLGQPSLTLALPVSVSEQGDVGYINLSAPLKSLYNQSRLSMSLIHKHNEHTEFIGIASQLFGSDHPAMNRAMLGAGLKVYF